MPHPLLIDLQRQLQQKPHIKSLIIGYSGGCDSHVLLDLLHRYRKALKVRIVEALHINHKLQSDADQWVEHCRNTCRTYKIPFRSVTVNAEASPGESPEAAARHARHQAFRQHMDKKSALLTAHHQDDQAETLLLQLFRGAGPRGMAAMPESVPLGKGVLWRPLLHCNHQTLRRYACERQLQWIEDPSNRDDRFDRNFLRRNIMPILDRRWPGCTAAIARSANLCGNSRHLLDDLADIDLTTCLNPDQTLDIARLNSLSLIRQSNVLHRWLQRAGLPLPQSRHYRELQQSIINARQDAMPLLHWQGGEIRRFKNKLFAMKPLKPVDSQQRWHLIAETPLTIPSLGQITLHTPQQSGLPLIRKTDQPLSIRLRQGGERFHPYWRKQSQTLKKLYQETTIPPWERDRLPLLYAEQQLIAVSGLGIAKDWLAESGEAGWQLVWNKMN